ncbi:hypothetical protein V7087_02560, partial [Neobacillus niacini]|uniref:hypothetical protein n=1 Tax=Neobacillus niacini TaxID=86668 RepID=UPI002FFEE70C
MPYSGMSSYMYPGQQMMPYSEMPSYMYHGQQMIPYSGIPSQLDDPGYFMFRQNVYTIAMSAAETGLSHLADYLADVKVESMTGAKANEIRTEVDKAVKQFLEAKGQLMNEIKALEVNPNANKQHLAELKKALAESENAATRIKTLNNLISSSDASLIGAVKSGHLAKTAREVANLVSRTKKIIDKSNAALGTIGSEKPGIVKINELKVSKGNMLFYMDEYHGGKEPIKANIEIPIRSFPIIIRASVEDDMKIKFRKEKKGGTTEGPQFIDVTDATDGHKFSYTNPRIGTTTWVSKEEYTWEPDTLSKEKITSLSQTNSDQSTEKSKGDKVEIKTVVPAQKVGFNVTGKTNIWKRESIIKNIKKQSEEIPTNNEGRAYINFSVFSK